MELDKVRLAFKQQLESSHPLSVESAKKALEIAELKNDERLIMKAKAHLEERISQQVLFYMARDASGMLQVWMLWSGDIEKLANKVTKVERWPAGNYIIPHLVLDPSPPVVKEIEYQGEQS